MPLQTQTIDLNAEIQRLQSEMEEVAEKHATLTANDAPDEQATQVLQQGNNLNNQINVLTALQDGALEGYDPVESVTLAGLTAGEVNLVEDIVDGNAGVRHRDAWVAIGTREGPYLEHDPESQLSVGGVKPSVVSVADLPLPYVQWAEQKISELSHVSEEEGNGFLELVQEKQAEQ